MSKKKEALKQELKILKNKTRTNTAQCFIDECEEFNNA